MCGIAGVVDLRRRPLDQADVAGMTEVLSHRGPDGEGVVHPVPWVGLGHRRLSIIDVDGGRQPLANEDETVWITFNGEIFNYRELRDELEGKGHRFRTRTDTEVVVHLYEELGPRCVERLSGQFAFALFDGERLFCARDPLGIKPFYYHAGTTRFAFASEPRAFLALQGFDPQPDLDALRLYLRYRYIPSPASALAGCRKLGPGEWLLLDGDGHVTRRRYWSLEGIEVAPAAEEGLLESILPELEGAVGRQLVADVPLGAFLSGGLDSSSVVALMARVAGAAPETFCMGFPLAAYDERRHAARVAEHVGCRHTARVIGTDEARAAMVAVLDHLDEPFADPAIVPSYLLARLARERVTVALSGDGGDELFAGYARYPRALEALSIPPRLRPLWRRSRKVWRGSRDPGDWRYPDDGSVDRLYLDSITRTGQGELPRMLGERFRDHREEGVGDPIESTFARLRDLPPLTRLLAADLQTSVPDYHLHRVDRASMQASLEVRVPLLDTRVVRTALRLPAAVMLRGRKRKGALRAVMRPFLPERTIARKKRGFRPPMDEWFGGELAELARERLRESLLVREGLLDAAGVAALADPKPGRAVNGRTVWRVLVLECWLRNLRKPRRDRAAPVPAPGRAAG